jgi:hypothetical protein
VQLDVRSNDVDVDTVPATMPEEINPHRLRFVGDAAMAIAAAGLGMVVAAQAQSGKAIPTGPPPKPGTRTWGE